MKILINNAIKFLTLKRSPVDEKKIYQISTRNEKKIQLLGNLFIFVVF